jgi:DNA-binding CsgD family transcriptional regulator
MRHLTRHDLAAALQLLAVLEAKAEQEPDDFEPACVRAVSAFIAASKADLAPSASSAAVALKPGNELALRLGQGVIVLKRTGKGFSDRDRERAELLRGHLSFLCEHAARNRGQGAIADSTHASPLTRRESEVMRWVARGKIDADIAALLAISPRTVQKHLEHIYVKLGVETRTAAVMRVRALG